MAEAYTRTLKFEVKDAQVRKAVKDLGKSLEGIDKSVNKINDAFSQSIRGGIKQTVKEVGNISKAVKKLVEIASKVEVVPRQKITQSLRDIRKIKAAMKDLQRTGSPFSSDGRKSDDFNASVDDLQKFVIAVRNGTQALSANEATLNKQAAAFARVAAGVKRGSAEYVNAVQAQEKAEQKLRLIQLDRIEAQEKLYALGAKDIKQLAGGVDMTGFKRVTQLLEMEEKEFGKGGKRDTIASLTAYRSELENVNRLLQIGSEEYLLTEQAIERMNKRLGVTTKLQRAQAKEASNTFKFYRNIGKETEKIAAKLASRSFRDISKIFGGQFGEPVRAAGFIGVSRLVEKLTENFQILNRQVSIPLFGQVQLNSLASFTRKVQEAFATIGFSYQGLSAVLGGASWVAGAVKGFIDFEQQAVLSFNRINSARRTLDINMSKWLSKAEPKFGKEGGSIGPTENKTSLIENLFGPLRFMMTGEGRLKDKLDEIYGAPHRFKERSPFPDSKTPSTGLAERLRENLADARAELEQMHSTNQYFEAQLKKVVDLEERQNKEIHKREKLYKEVSPTEQAKKLNKAVEEGTKSFDKFNKAAEKYKNMRMDNYIEDQDKMLKYRMAQDDKATQREMQNDKKKNAADLKDFDRRLKEAVQKRELRAGARQSAMIGGAFPLLFGQGPFAAAGGAIGGYVGGLQGQQGGFAGSLIGTQVVASIQGFITSTVEVGKAFSSVQGSFDFMSQKALFSSDKIKEHVKALIKQGESTKAAAILAEEFVNVFGSDSLDKLNKLKDEAKELNKEWSKLTINLQLMLSGPLSNIIKILNRFLEKNTTAGASDFSLGEGKGNIQFSKDQKTFIDNYKAVLDNMSINQLDNLLSSTSGANAEGINLKPYQKHAIRQYQMMRVTNTDSPLLTNENKVEKAVAGAGINPSYAETEAEKLANKIHDKEMEILDIKINKVKETEKEGELTNAMEYSLGEKILMAEKEVALLKAGTNEKLKQKIEAQYDLKLLQLKVDTLEEMDQLWKDIGVSVKDGLVEGINAAIDGTKTLGEVASNTFRRISNALLNYGVESALIGMTGGKGGFFSEIFGRASGGPVKGGSPYVVGEKGPELFVPGSSGNIVPNHAMGGANVVVNVDASGSSVEGDAGQAEQLGSMLAAAVQAEIANQQRPGGLLARR